MIYENDNAQINLCYEEIKQEVKEYIIQIEQLPNFLKYSKGTQVLFSDLYYKPKFMFIGINPGGGFSKYNSGKRIEELDIQTQLEYSYEYYKYSLAVNTRKLFEMANCTEYLKKAVKSNCFFFATTNEKELYQMVSHIKHLDVYKKSDDWILRLVGLAQPEIIICEGSSSFNRFTSLQKCEGIWNNNVGYAKSNGVHIIGYKRIYSHIKSKERVAEKIKTVLLEVNNVVC